MHYLKSFLSVTPFSTSWGLVLLRLLAGATMLSHGSKKFLSLLQGDFAFGDPLGIGEEISFILVVFAEFICSILLILGLTTRFALVPLIITMAVAFFIVHGSDDFGSKELPFLYLGIYAVLFIMGPGKISIDAHIGKKFQFESQPV